MSLTDLGVSLGKEEQVMGQYVLSYSILLFFIKSEFYVTNKRFIARIPNVILFVIPLGANTVTYPLRNITAIRNKTRFKFFKLVISVILIITGLGFLSQVAFIGLILLVVGLISAVESFPALVNIETTSGGGLWYPIAPWEKASAQQLANEVNQAIVEL